MSRTRGGKPRKEPPKGELRKPRPVWFVTLMAFVLPGSGQMFNGAPARGVIMQFGMVFGGYVTYQLTTPEISPIGRLAGGLLVWVFSIVDANGIANRRVKAWARIEAQQADKASRSAKERPAGGAKTGTTVKSSRRPARKKGVDRAVGREPLAAGAGSGGAANQSIPGGAGPAASEPPEV